MDPLTHGLLGGVVAQAFHKKPIPRFVPWVAAVGAMAPDLDFLIRSKSSPLLFFEFHRHFTHSLAFIPVGGALVAFLFWIFFRRKVRFWKLLIPATLGYATHSLLDACTSYGIMLYWPFSRERAAWDIINIVDPIYSGLLLLGFVGAVVKKGPNLARIFFLLSCLYLGFGVYQHQEALAMQRRLAEQRGHRMESVKVIPTLGNELVWRTLYRHRGELFIDAIRIVPGDEAQYWEGGRVPAFILSDTLNKIPPQSPLAHDLEVFVWFSDAWVGILPNGDIQLGDMRFSVLPDSLKPLWGIHYEINDPEHGVERLRFSSRFRENLAPFLDFVWGRAPGMKSLH